MNNHNNIAIVLTGTIIPNSNAVVINNPETRRVEYLKAINYYTQFAPVFFLENSSYTLMSDSEFIQIPNLTIRQFPASSFPERGKGFQEFEMIDNWVKTEKNIPKYWIKITGRYIYLNFQDIIEDCRSEKKYSLIVDKTKIFKIAHSCLFYTTTDFYKRQLVEMYKDCDERLHKSIEQVFYKEIVSLQQSNSRIFSIEPKLVGVSGSNGKKYGKNQYVYYMKSIIRKITYLVDKNYIYHSRWQY